MVQFTSKDGTTWLRESDTPEEFSRQLYTGLSCPSNEDGRGEAATPCIEDKPWGYDPQKNQTACVIANTTGMDFVLDVR